MLVNFFRRKYTERRRLTVRHQCGFADVITTSASRLDVDDGRRTSRRLRDHTVTRDRYIPARTAWRVVTDRLISESTGDRIDKTRLMSCLSAGALVADRNLYCAIICQLGKKSTKRRITLQLWQLVGYYYYYYYTICIEPGPSPSDWFR